MPTIKPRINISVSKNVKYALEKLADRDQMPTATYAERLLEMALELEEDYAFGMIAKARDTKGVRYIPHNEFWKKVKK